MSTRPSIRDRQTAAKLIREEFESRKADAKQRRDSDTEVERHIAELIKKEKLAPDFDKIKKLKQQLEAAKEVLEKKINTVYTKLVPRNSRPRYPGEGKDKLEAIAGYIHKSSVVTQTELNALCRKLLSRVETAKTDVALEKVYKDAGLL